MNKLLFYLVSVVFILSLYVVLDFPGGMGFVLTNFLLYLCCIKGLSTDPTKVYSLEKMVYVFFLFFFCVVPLFEEAAGVVYWGGRSIGALSKSISNSIAIVGLVFFWFGARLSVGKRPVSMGVFSLPRKLPRKFFVVVLVTLYFLILNNFDFDLYRLIFRSISVDYRITTSVESEQAVRLIFGNFLRPMVVCLLIILLLKKRKATGLGGSKGLNSLGILEIFTLASTFFLIFPTSVPRFQAAALYIPLVLLMTSLWNYRYSMAITTVGALLVIFPFLDKFRRFDPETFTLEIDYEFLLHGHFDAYQNFSRVVDSSMITYGQQLIGVFLFFVPRSLWEGKPFGSGYSMAIVENLSLKNISMPYIAEGYVNFGVAGVIIFMLFIGILLGYLDKVAWSLSRSEPNHGFLGYYFLLFGMVFFIMRGDLLSSFAYTAGLTAAYLTLLTMTRLIVRLTKSAS